MRLDLFTEIRETRQIKHCCDSFRWCGRRRNIAKTQNREVKFIERRLRKTQSTAATCDFFDRPVFGRWDVTRHEMEGSRSIIDWLIPNAIGPASLREGKRGVSP